MRRGYALIVISPKLGYKTTWILGVATPIVLIALSSITGGY